MQLMLKSNVLNYSTLINHIMIQYSINVLNAELRCLEVVIWLRAILYCIKIMYNLKSINVVCMCRDVVLMVVLIN